MASRFIQALVAEIRRRKVFRAVVIYALSAWVVLQVADLTFKPLGFPDWSMQALILVTVIGFPLVFVLTWCIETGPDGFMFDLPLWRGLDPDRPRSEGTMDLIVVISLILMLGVGTFWGVRLFLDEIKDTEVASIAAPPNSIAVLSFANRDAEAPARDFANGLAEEILDLLAGIDELNVAARTSSFRFRDEDIDVREVARILSVRHVIEGSVRQSGERVRISSRLVNGESGKLDWNETYERELEDIFAIQQEIATAVVNSLKLVLSVEAEERLKSRPTENVEAYIYYLEGKGRLGQTFDPDVMRASVQLFEQAIAIDPNFARAYAGICVAHQRLYEIMNSVADFESAEQACNTALELQASLDSDVGIALGGIYRYRGWYDQAEEILRATIEVAPGEVDAYIELGEVYKAQNRRDEALRQFSRAVELKQNYWRAHEAMADYYYGTERYDLAAAFAETVIRLMPDSAAAFATVGASYWMQGDYERASEAYLRSLELKPSRQGYTNMGLRYYYAGQFENSVAMQLQAIELAPDDHRVWGRLAESYRFMDGHQAEATHAYEQAAAFAESNLEINPNDWTTLGLLSLYYAHTDRGRDALRSAARAVELSDGNAEAYYYQALALLETGNPDASLDALEAAVAADAQYRQFIETDPDLQALSDSERYQNLLPP